MTDKLTHEELAAKVKALEAELKEVRTQGEFFHQEAEIYKNLLDLAQGPITITRVKDGVFRFVNDTFCRCTGYSRDEVLGRKSTDLHIFADPGQRERLTPAFRSQGQLEGVEVNYRAKDGGILECIISAARIRFHGEDCIMLSSTIIANLEKIQRDLQESEEKYRLVVETANEGIAIVQDGRWRLTNIKSQQLLGYSAHELDGSPIADNVHSDDRDLVAARQRQRQMGESVPEIYEVRLVDRSGQIHWVESRSIFIKWHGQPATLSLMVDTTERRRIEEERLQSERSYMSVMELAPDAISIADIEDGRYRQVNRAFSRMTGFSVEEAIGHTTSELNLYVDPADRKRMINIISEKGQVDSLEFDFQIKSGEIRHGLVSARPIQFQGQSCVMVIAKNITDLIKAREALRQSEQTYRLLVENAYEGISITQNGMVIFANKRMEDLTGYRAENLPAISFETLIHPADRPDIMAWLEQIEEGRKTGPRSFRLANRDGSTCWVELNAVPLIWGGRRAILHFLRDTSLQKKMEAQLIQAGKMEALGTLAGGIAHNFNNMLMGIQGHVALMMLDMDFSHPHHERLRHIETVIRDAALLTRELLGLARGGKFEVKATNINRLIDVSADLFGRTRKEIRFHHTLQQDLWTVEVDRSQIEQVFLNLFVNASQAMPGGGDLDIETQNVNLDAYYTSAYNIAPGRFVRISITDTGVGMDAATLKRVFDPFFTTKEMGRGTGLGLASAYGIIHNHGGIINAYSEEGRGATFNIYLPVSDKAIPEETFLPDEIRTGTETILLVDDEEMILRIGEEILARLGYQVMTAKSGDEATCLFEQHHERVDLVILDMIMPGIGGGGIFDRLKTIDDRVVVLLSSGYSLNGQAKKIMDRGCRGFIQKPYSASDLSRKLREILDA